MPDLFPHIRREITKCFELVVDRKSHGDGGFHSAGNCTRKHKVERADFLPNSSRQCNTFHRKVRADATCLALLGVGVPSNLDGAQSVKLLRGLVFVVLATRRKLRFSKRIPAARRWRTIA